MAKIRCYDCDYYAEMTDAGYCRYNDKKIPLNNEKTRCKHFCQTDLRWKCALFRPWVETNKGEVNRTCVDDEKRAIRRCGQYNHPERCPDFIDKIHVA